jgi:hypothetical protein
VQPACHVIKRSGRGQAAFYQGLSGSLVQGKICRVLPNLFPRVAVPSPCPPLMAHPRNAHPVASSRPQEGILTIP